MPNDAALAIVIPTPSLTLSHARCPTGVGQQPPSGGPPTQSSEDEIDRWALLRLADDGCPLC